MDFRVSYAQNREDFLIAAFFPDIEVGHYVDAGAGHPEQQSVSKLLYDRGWSGINIEPIPELAAALRAERPRDVTLQVALAATPGAATFRQYAGWGLSTLSSAMVTEHEAHPTSWTEEYTEYTVETVTLADVLKEHPLPHVHVFKVDVEGAEYDVLTGVDWQLFAPDLICIETEHMREDWHPLLRAAGYGQVFHDGLNAYLLSAGARDRAAHFNYAEVVLDGPTIVTPPAAAELELARQLRLDIAAERLDGDRLRMAIAERDAAIADRDATIAELTATLSDRDSTVAQLSQTVAERDATIAELDATATDLTHALTAESELRVMYTERHTEVTERLATTEAYLLEILASTSWRVTYPLRRSLEILRARLPRRLLVRLWRRFRTRPQPPAPAAVDQPSQPLLSPDTLEVLNRMRELS